MRIDLWYKNEGLVGIYLVTTRYDKFEAVAGAIALSQSMWAPRETSLTIWFEEEDENQNNTKQQN